MPLPVLIAARNEAPWMGRTLDSLPRDGVEPIVIPNGCIDDTAAIAESFGATVLHCAEEGKMQAIQTGIRYLGERSVEPFVTLDADSQIMFPSRWAGCLLSERAKIDTAKPAVAIGSTIYRGVNLTAVARTARHFYMQHRDRYQNSRGYYCGRNMLIHAMRPEVVEDLLDLGPIWFGEDMAIKDKIVEHGGNSYKSTRLFGTVYSDGVRLMPFRFKFSRESRRQNRERLIASYLAEAPPGSYPYAPSIQRNLGDSHPILDAQPANN